ncbi:ketoacyl-ACP synthase III [Campylobacter jejuni]|uniref:ketoacyl-ACP synthase III n=3 Tax=Campylobacter jejuni TaxID=197 RepID=UPI00069C89B6|nr:ketoacyl-ACP synthase III [Campylobacter jejuni]ECL3019068.1 ketoacyl-ACP synthase III [Campylobacter jejuni]ECO3962649.1 ketoacyl-ACP synthase III [Campylobacter jejuni]ECO6468305.1 ketoacyl-ACP synthase III [Campylobacter jejuni]ECP9346120.1 ketoacyl-ACP synthase III [Campylobacter jejuni]EIA7117686.1 ketoacyl-ACP synthase III [Campylobacter jejuni]
MQSFSQAKIAHITSIIPSKKCFNRKSEHFSEREINKTLKHIGVETRYVIDKDKNEKISDLFLKAANKTLKVLQWDKESIDAIIVVSQSNEFRFPAMACYLQGKLGLRQKDLFAFDINLGCSGYVYGLNVAYNYISNGLNRILLFVGDVSSNVIDQNTRDVALLFGDGVSCTAIENKISQSYFCFKTLGKGYDCIMAPYGGGVMQMKGVDVFDFALKHIPLEIDRILQFSSLKKESISQFYFHQANAFLLTYLGNKLNIQDKLPININNFGNTSSNSIPLLISDTKDKDYCNVILMGFGVGLSVATCMLETLDCTCTLFYEGSL